MSTMALNEGFNLLSHLKEPYQKWLKTQNPNETRNWREFVKKLVKVNNEQDGTEEDLIFVAEDAMNQTDAL